jgi:2-amino-4-hydroxy-6-hydroxymethyldihydropteridine diphosphokinase
MGRIRTVQNAPRIIDIDILFFNKEIINTPILKVPHPQITNRKFVLIPLNELSPNFKHPVLQQNIHQLLSICTDSLNVLKK